MHIAKGVVGLRADGRAAMLWQTQTDETPLAFHSEGGMGQVSFI